LSLLEMLRYSMMRLMRQLQIFTYRSILVLTQGIYE